MIPTWTMNWTMNWAMKRATWLVVLGPVVLGAVIGSLLLVAGPPVVALAARHRLAVAGRRRRSRELAADIPIYVDRSFPFTSILMRSSTIRGPAGKTTICISRMQRSSLPWARPLRSGFTLGARRPTPQ
jgi:hypothetical protein